LVIKSKIIHYKPLFIYKGKTKFVSAIFRCFKLPFDDNDSTQFNIPYQLTYERPLTNSEEEFFFDHLLQFKVKIKNINFF